jgi:hypothetical protein
MPKAPKKDEKDEVAARKKAVAEVYEELHRMVSVIRAHRGINVADVFDRFGGPGITREYRKCLDEMNRDFGGEGG